MRSRKDRAGLAAKVLTFLTVIGVLMGGFAGVAISQPAPVDLAGGAYPPPLPEGCTVQTLQLPGGEAVMEGEAFTINGNPVPISNRNIGGALNSGDEISVTWDGIAPGCEPLGFSLSVKATKQASGFAPNDNQELVDFVYCGPGGAVCTTVGNTLTLQMPTAVAVPCWQVDFVIGTPLKIVGPDGDYYRFQQPIDMLIASKNGGTAPCNTAEVCPTNPAIIASAFECGEPELVPPPPAPCEFDASLAANDPACVAPPAPCEFDASLAANDPACVAPPAPCALDASLAENDPACVPCAFNDQILANSVDCQEPKAPCSLDATLTADDPACVPCSHDGSILAGSEACTPCALDAGLNANDPNCAPCATDANILATSANCQPAPAPCEFNAALAADDPGCIAPPPVCAEGFVLDEATQVCGAVVVNADASSSDASSNNASGSSTQVESNIVSVQPDATLPFTGSSHRTLTGAAAVTMFAGAMLTVATRRPQGAHYRS